MKTRVPTIVALLALSGCQDQPAINATKQHITAIRTAIQLYELEFGAIDLSDARQVFTELTGKNKRGMVFISKEASEKTSGVFLDTWARPLEIFGTGKGVLIRSLGANGVLDSSSNSDDIY